MSFLYREKLSQKILTNCEVILAENFSPETTETDDLYNPQIFITVDLLDV